MTSPDLKWAGKQHLGKHKPPKDYFAQHPVLQQDSAKVLCLPQAFTVHLLSPFSAPLSLTRRSPSQHNPAEILEVNSSTNTRPLAIGCLTLRKKKEVFFVYPEWPRADIHEGFQFEVVRMKERGANTDKLSSSFFFFIYFSQSRKKMAQIQFL